MREATSYVEWMLNVDLGNIHRIFNELCIRSNPTQYLDELREALLRKVEQVNGRSPRPKKKI